jgi:hypothetical protein
MRIMLCGTYVGVVSSIGLALLLHSNDALARRYTIQYQVMIERGASSISNENRVGIANLLIDARSTFAKGGPIVIYAYTDETEPGGTALTKRRVMSAVEYLRALGVTAEINVEYNVWRKGTDVPPSLRYQLLLELLPGPDFHD